MNRGKHLIPDRWLTVVSPVLFLIFYVGVIDSAAAADRVALVIGVDTYDYLPSSAQLKVAVDDAELIAGTLQSLEPPFDVEIASEAGWTKVQQAFDRFLDRAKDAECAVVYFAGHGIEYNGENFLLVRDTDVPSITSDVGRMKRRLASQSVSLQSWVDSFDQIGADLKLVILDCCRDNPLEIDDEGGKRSVVGRARGLAQLVPPSGTLISYSADAGQQANDGLFTATLANHLKNPELSLLKVFAATREEVRRTSEQWAKEDKEKNIPNGSRRVIQEPAEYSKLNLAATDFRFANSGMNDGQSPGSDLAKLRAELMEAQRKIEEMKSGTPKAKGDSQSDSDPAPGSRSSGSDMFTSMAMEKAWPKLEGEFSGKVPVYGKQINAVYDMTVTVEGETARAEVGASGSRKTEYILKSWKAMFTSAQFQFSRSPDAPASPESPAAIRITPSLSHASVEFFDDEGRNAATFLMSRRVRP